MAPERLHGMTRSQAAEEGIGRVSRTATDMKTQGGGREAADFPRLRRLPGFSCLCPYKDRPAACCRLEHDLRIFPVRHGAAAGDEMAGIPLSSTIAHGGRSRDPALALRTT